MIGENQMAGVCVIVDLYSVLGGSAPVPDGEGGVGCPGANAVKAEDAGEAIEVDGGVRAEGQEADRFIEGSADSHAASGEIDDCVIVDGVLCRDEEGATVINDDL